MTPAEWENMFTVAHGSFDSAFDRVKQTLLSLKPHEGFAVYADYGLEPSTTETLPEPDLPNLEAAGGWPTTDTGMRQASSATGDKALRALTSGIAATSASAAMSARICRCAGEVPAFATCAQLGRILGATDDYDRRCGTFERFLSHTQGHSNSP